MFTRVKFIKSSHDWTLTSLLADGLLEGSERVSQVSEGACYTTAGITSFSSPCLELSQSEFFRDIWRKI